jgi:hypothetical protein
MQEFGISTLDAALKIAEKIDRTRGHGGTFWDAS